MEVKWIEEMTCCLLSKRVGYLLEMDDECLKFIQPNYKMLRIEMMEFRNPKKKKVKVKTPSVLKADPLETKRSRLPLVVYRMDGTIFLISVKERPF